MNWRRWNWRGRTTPVNDILLPLAFAIMRACGPWLWLEVAHYWLAPSRQEPFLPLPLMVALVLGGMVAARIALAGDRNINRARLGVAVAGLALVVLALWWAFLRAHYPLADIRWLADLGTRLTRLNDDWPALFATLLAVVYLWLQGVLDGRSSLYNENAWRAFGLGFLAMASALVVAKAMGGSMPAGTLNVVLTFFAAAMSALAITGLQQADYGLEKDEPRLRTRRYWLVSVASVVVGLLALGLLLSALIAPENVAQALRWTFVILDILGRGLYLVLLALSYVLFLFIEPLIKLLRTLLQAGSSDTKLQLPDFQRQFEELAKDNSARPLVVWGGFRWIGLALLIMLIGLLFAWALRRFWKGEDEGVEETRQTILTRDLLQEQFSALWRELLKRLRRTSATVLSPFLSLEGEAPTRRIIRSIYQALLSTATEREQPRARGQTPLEYQRTLEGAFPEGRESLSVITQEYMQARYAPEPPTERQAERTRQAWDRIQLVLKTQDDGESG